MAASTDRTFYLLKVDENGEITMVVLDSNLKERNSLFYNSA
jgi:hypothetical protein